MPPMADYETLIVTQDDGILWVSLNRPDVRNAISAQMQSVIPTELRVLDAGSGLPELPASSIVLLRNRSRSNPVTETMAEHIVEGFRL